MSINAGTVYIDVKPDMSGFGSAVSSGVSKTTTGSTSSKLRSGLSKFGKTLAVPLAGALVVGVGAAINAASDMQETWAKTKQVFEENAQGIKDWSKDAATAMGMSQEAAMSSASHFGALMDAMGVGAEETSAWSIQLTQLSADLASFNNMDSAEVHDKIAAALAGEYDGMKALGVVINETRIKQEAMRMGLIKEGEELTAAQKATVAYQLIMKDTKKAQGDFARTADSVANKQRTANAQFADAAAKLGKHLLPMVAKVMEWMSKFIIWVVKDFVPAFRNGLAVISDWARRLKDTIVGVFDGIKGAIAAAYNWIVTNVLNPMITGINTIIKGINLVKPGGDITPLDYINAWTPSDSRGGGGSGYGGGSTADEVRGGGGPSATTRGRIIVEDRTAGGITAREDHEKRMARSRR